MLDYRALPFISSQSPYLESLRPDRAGARRRARRGATSSSSVYGWSRAPIFASGTSVWTLPGRGVRADGRLARRRSGRRSTRDGRALPRLLPERSRRHLRARLSGHHLVRSPGQPRRAGDARRSSCTSRCSSAATLFNALTSATPASGRALLREIRSSFYRKLFLAFVAARRRAGRRSWRSRRAPTSPRSSRAGVEEAAARTATVGAARSSRTTPTLQQRGAGALERASTTRSWCSCSRAIDQDVNLFDRARLQATSERDLFASGLLSTRTPGDVYRRDRARPAADLRRRRGGRRLPATCWPPRPCAPAAARASSPCRCTLRQQEIERADRRARSAGAVRRRCSSACSAPRSATGWRSASPTRSTG